MFEYDSNGLIARSQVDAHPDEAPTKPDCPKAPDLEKALQDALQALRECEARSLFLEKQIGAQLSEGLRNAILSVGDASVGAIDRTVETLGCDYVQWLEETDDL